MIAGFIIAPFLLHQLGDEGYGLWVLIASMTGYFDLFDLGLRGSLGRNLAFAHAKGDANAVRTVFNTGLALLMVGSALVMLATLASLYFFFWIFEIPDNQIWEVRLSLLLIGINLALIFPTSVFEGALWAYQRFDILNIITIPSVALRAILTFAMVGTESGNLIVLAAIVLGTTMISGAAKAWAAFRLDKAIRIDLGKTARDAIKQLFDFGIWLFLLSIAKQISKELGPLLIGSLLRVALVAPFNFANRLVKYVDAILMSSTGVLTPLATRFHVEEKHSQQERLFVYGGRVTFAVALYFLVVFLFLGDTFLSLWMGKTLEYAYPLLIILMVGEVLPFSQLVTYSMVLGMDRHRLWAMMSIVEVVLILTLAAILVPFYDIIGIALAIAIPGALCRGLIQMVYACRLLKMPVGRYVLGALLPPIITAVLAGSLLWLTVSWHIPEDWFEFTAYLVGFSLVSTLIGAITLVTPAEWRSLSKFLRRRDMTPADEMTTTVVVPRGDSLAVPQANEPIEIHK